MIHNVCNVHKGCLAALDRDLYISRTGSATFSAVAMRVGELSRRTGIGVGTLRAWERRFGLLEPERSPSGQRLYTEDDVERVAAVSRLVTDGLTLSAAATRVSAAGPGALSATQREAFLLHQALHAAGEGIWVSQQGVTRLANRRMAELLGCSVDELMDRSVFDFVDPIWLERAELVVQRLRAGNRVREELGLRRPDGSTFLAEVHATPMRDNAGAYDGAVAVVTDVTVRAAAEADGRFRTAALDAIGEAVVATDPDATIHYVNPAAEALLGWRATELVGQNGLDLLPARTVSAEAREVFSRLVARRRQTGEMKLIRRDGTHFRAQITGTPIVDAKGQLVGLIAVIRDDSERRRREREMLLQEQQAETIAVLGTRILASGARHKELILAEAVEACRRVLGGEIAAFLDVGGPGEDLMVRVCSPHRPQAGPTPGGSRSIAGYTALAGKAVFVTDAARDRRFELPPPPEWRGPISSAVAAPVYCPDGVCGVVIVGSEQRNAFTPSSTHFVQSVANVIGMALLH